MNDSDEVRTRALIEYILIGLFPQVKFYGIYDISLHVTIARMRLNHSATLSKMGSEVGAKRVMVLDAEERRRMVWVGV